jgi:hypothetical protein
VSRVDRSSSDLDPLFESAKALDRVSDVARARIRARARASVAAASTLPMATPEHPRRLRLAVAAGVAFVLGATGAAAAFLGHGLAVHRTGPTEPLPRMAPIVKLGERREPVLPSADTGPVVEATTPRPHRHASSGWDARAAELALIQKAQSAYANGDLPNALQLLAEHSRRFPNGRLAEEREALRVRSLAGCGRSADARRALQAFADRYPDSVLLPHLQETLGSGTRP